MAPTGERFRAPILRGAWPIVLAVLSGCSPAPVTVRGDVTVDGKPLAKGVISFGAAEGQGDPVTVPIEEGRYELKTLPGNKWVQISAPVVKRKVKEYDGPTAPWLELTEESLPERYNASTELKYEVVPGDNTKDWPLTRKKQ